MSAVEIARGEQPQRRISEVLSRFAAGLTYDALPQNVRERAKHLILDGVGIALASTTYDFARRTLAGLASLGPGGSDVIGTAVKLALRDAVLMNGVLIHGLDYDDTHLVGVVHATSSCFPTALGVAAQANAPGRELLAAYVLGIEVAGRLGAVAKGELNQVGFHPTGVVAAFACTLVASRLHAMNEQQMTMAQGIALSMASGSREYSADGAWTKRLHPGWAGAAGITAAALARQGFVGPRAAYEGRYGLFPLYLGAAAAKADYAAATAALGEKWELGEVAIKPLPACQLSIACIDAAIALSRERDIDPAGVARVKALVPQHAVKIVCEPLADKRRPRNSYAAQFSIPFGVACGLVHGRYGLAELEHIEDPAILALADKVEYEVDARTGYPRHFSGEVIVTMKDGRQFAHREQVNRGAADRPLSNDEIAEKFMDNAGLAVARERAHALCDTILNIDRIESAREISRRLALGRGDAAARKSGPGR